MAGGMKTGFGPIQHHLTMIAHPNFVDGLDTDKGAAQGFNTVRKAFHGCVVNTFKNVEISRANQMATANPTL